MGIPLAGYPTSFGNKRVSVVELTGPASYTPFTTIPVPTGGVQLLPSDVGLKGFDVVEPSTAATTLTGYTIIPIYPNAGEHKISPYVTLVWVDVNTGAQPVLGTNLSAVYFRLFSVGW